jgi:cysteinyl-tRNA synthetase
LTPTVEPRATDNIQGMIEMIGTLINKGHAYVASGEVLFGVDSMKDYGQLSNRKLDEQQAGARVAVEAHKKNPADFVLWKLSSAEEPGWESPWGRGRPGWHIECSAMSKRYLGEVFDIHGGGLDLIFPHHENEIAQSCCAFGRDGKPAERMANYWMHNGFLQVEGKKMSKSDGNFYTIFDHTDSPKFGGQVWYKPSLRYAMLSTHYRQPLDWTVKRLQQANKSLQKFYLARQNLNKLTFGPIYPPFLAALLDDLNFHEANRQLEALAAMVANEKSEAKKLDFAGMLNVSLQLYGINWGQIEPPLTSDQIDELNSDIVSLINDRLLARHTKNWKESDRIRDQLAAMGIAIKDNKDGTTTWEEKR